MFLLILLPPYLFSLNVYQKNANLIHQMNLLVHIWEKNYDSDFNVIFLSITSNQKISFKQVRAFIFVIEVTLFRSPCLYVNRSSVKS